MFNCFELSANPHIIFYKWAIVYAAFDRLGSPYGKCFEAVTE